MQHIEPIITDVTQGAAMTTPPPAVRNVRVLLSPFLQDGLESFAVGYTEVAAGDRGTRHRHAEAEIWLFFAGSGRAIVGDREVQTFPGMVIYTPAGVDHQFLNTGDETVKLYYLFVPSGAEKHVIDGSFR